ncbi:MAG: hypothetical protein H6Q89_4219 [Myxococcaceae bacterium]|nr:hypothetical protein [Myxococcaceae bacterium]
MALVLSQSSVKKVEIIRGKTAKKAPQTETSLAPAPNAGPTAEQQAREQQLEQKATELDQRAEALKEKDAASEAKKERDAKAQAAQQKILEKHARDLQLEYERAANSLAGQE